MLFRVNFKKDKVDNFRIKYGVLFDDFKNSSIF